MPGGLPPAGCGEVVAARPPQVVRHLGRPGVGGGGCGLHRERDRQVRALRVAQVGAGGLGEQRVPVAQAAARAVQEPGVEHAPFGVAGAVPGVVTAPRQRRDLGRGQPAPGRRNGLRERPRVLGQPAERGPHQRPQVGRGRRPVQPARGRRPCALHRQQRVAVGRRDHPLDRRVRQRRERAHHLGHRPARQRAELDLGDLHAAARQIGQQRVGVGVGGPVAAGQHEQHGQRGEPSTDVRGEGEARAVGPVHVLGYEEYRPARRRPLDEPEHGVEDPQPLQLRRGDQRRRALAAQRTCQIGSEPAELGGPAERLRRPRHDRRERAGELLPQLQRGLAADIDARADRTRAPALSARRASSPTRRVLPIPASPVTSTT